MNARFSRIAIAAIVVMTCRAALGAGPFGLPYVDELTHAGAAINHYVAAVRPWWTCEYSWTEAHREANAIVYEITFAGNQKCSRTKRTEYFDLFYSRKLDKVIKMVPANK